MSATAAGPCRRHRPGLLALLEDPLGGQLAPAARGHLDACAACRAEFGQLVLAGFVVRRAFDADPLPEPSALAWRRLRARVDRREPSRGRAASPVLGLALGAGLAVTLLLPLGALHVGGSAPLPVPAAIHEAGMTGAIALYS